MAQHTTRVRVARRLATIYRESSHIWTMFTASIRRPFVLVPTICQRDKSISCQTLFVSPRSTAEYVPFADIARTNQQTL